MAVVLRNSGGRVVTSTAARDKYVRDPQYLDLPTLVNGDEKIYLLAKIYENANYFRFYATGNYQIDWGDGQGVQTYTSGTYADYEIDWNNISASTVTTYGYRQAIITVEPQAGASLTVFQAWVNATNPNDPINYNPQIVDVKMAGQNYTNLGLAFGSCIGLEQFEFVGTAPNLTTVQQMFVSCYRLEKIVSFDTSNVTNFRDFLSGCSELKEIPKFSLLSATNVLNMFENNYRLTYIEPWDLDNEAPNLTSIQLMFDGVSVENVPISSCNNITDFTYAFWGNKFKRFDLPCPSAIAVGGMFQSCSELEVVTTNFPSTITNTSYMFNGCAKLSSIVPWDTSNVTNCSFMFTGTQKLKDVSSFDFSSATVINEMYSSRVEKPASVYKTGVTLTANELFYGNTRVKDASALDGIKVNTLFRFFRNCSDLERVPNLDVSAVTDIRQSFSGCNKITSLPAWDLSGVTLSDTITFGSCLSLRESNIFGLTKTHSYAACQLDRAAIVNIFNNLGTAVSQTIYVNGTPGAANLTAGDIAIATGKGWTVVN